MSKRARAETDVDLRPHKWRIAADAPPALILDAVAGCYDTTPERLSLNEEACAVALVLLNRAHVEPWRIPRLLKVTPHRAIALTTHPIIERLLKAIA